MVVLQESQNVMAINDEKTLGFTLELYTNYMDNVKVSLFCNICYVLVRPHYGRYA